MTVFAAANFDDLKEDMARGQGEHLSSFAVLLGVPREQQPEFFTFTRERFPLVFHSERVTPDEMLETFTRELATHPRFRTLTAAK